MLQRLTLLIRGRAAGAMVAQMWQAVGSLGLQLLAAWLLGARGLGQLSLSLGVIVLATAVASGMVGDSLVILDRHDPRIRGALQLWALILAVASFGAAFVGMTLSGALDPASALLMGLALVAFQIEELVRRVFMATMRFWRLVVIDSAAVLTAFAVVAAWAAASEVRFDTFLLALLVGQVMGAVIGVLMLPTAERKLVAVRGAALRQVARLGAWRGVQVAVAPAVLTAMRVIVTAVAGAAALGGVELARIYTAPALLAVQGLGSYLLSSYVRDNQLPLLRLRQRAWRASIAMSAGALLVGAVLAAAGPALAGTVSGPHLTVDRITVSGWVVYVVALALLQPFASLAAARGRPARVFWCRCIDATLVIALLPALLLVGLPAAVTPFVLAAGLLIGGVLVRGLVLRPLLRADVGENSADPTRTPAALS